MRRMLACEGWKGQNLGDPSETEGGPEVWREMSLASVLGEEDHAGAVQHFFVEALRQLVEELVAAKNESPDLPWNGD